MFRLRRGNPLEQVLARDERSNQCSSLWRRPSGRLGRRETKSSGPPADKPSARSEAGAAEVASFWKFPSQMRADSLPTGKDQGRKHDHCENESSPEPGRDSRHQPSREQRQIHARGQKRPTEVVEHFPPANHRDFERPVLSRELGAPNLKYPRPRIASLLAPSGIGVAAAAS